MQGHGMKVPRMHARKQNETTMYKSRPEIETVNK